MPELLHGGHATRGGGVEWTTRIASPPDNMGLYEHRDVGNGLSSAPEEVASEHLITSTRWRTS